MILEGAHTIQHVDPTITFSVIVYGNADKESYGFAAGMRLARINAPCEVTPSIRGDGIDNDCDGRIDEEICDGEKTGMDMDGDSAINEDCAAYVPVATLPTVPPTEPSTSSSTPPIIIGPEGPPGPPGPVGPPGVIGPPGIAGYDGFPGNPGADGVDGKDGEKGDVGSTGLTGVRGVTGATGESGAVGTTGATGITGPSGVTGMEGIKGIQGNQGISIRGEPGVTGATGINGATGSTGQTGSTGVTGPKGSQGQTGDDGQPGTAGAQGSKGEMGRVYQDENECLRVDNPCSDGCVNTIGSFYCTCTEGYVLDDSLHVCIDADECSHNNGGCADVCVDSVGSYACECHKEGYSIAADGRSCVDTDECALFLHNCTAAQSCVNTMGGHICVSMQCLLPPESTTTPLTLPSCSEGKLLNGLTGGCVDFDECSVNNGGCTDECKNLVGSFYCACSVGYTLAGDSQSCVDIDECAIESSGCSQNELCINTIGSFHCFPLTTDCGNVPVISPSSAFGALDTSSMVNGDLILGFLLWLVVLTVLFLCLLICSCKQLHDQKTESKDHKVNLREIIQSLPTSPEVPYHRVEPESMSANESLGRN